MTKYKIGDVVWQAVHGKHTLGYLPCPICYGKREVTVILGNDDRVVTPCNYCEEGYRGPIGTVREYKIMTTASKFTITGMEINMCGNEEIVEYRMNHYIAKEKDLFDTQEEALKAAEELKAQAEKDEYEKAERLKHDNLKSYSWNAGHHLREAKQAQHDFEYHSKKAVLCKAKAKNKE